MRPMTHFAAAAVAATALMLPAAPAHATSAYYAPDIARIQAVTPSCRANPGFAWEGRVSGILVGPPVSGTSFVGCFPTRADCERWRGPLSGYITGRLILNECRPRY